jgi:hypothetical protein
LERGAGLQGLVDEGLVSETEMMRSLAFGGERVASYSKKFTQAVNYFIKQYVRATVEQHESASNGFAGLHMQLREG